MAVSSYYLLILQLLLSAVGSTPPEEPFTCVSANTNCTVTNAYGTFPDRSVCRAAKVVYPTNEVELVTAVAEATRIRQKMRVVTRFGHSIPKLACTDGEDGLLISTKFLNRTVSVDPNALTMTAESGLSLRQFIRDAAAVGMALPCGPYWWGSTVGGLLATGSHGSTLRVNGSGIHDYVTEIRLISPGTVGEGFVKVRVLNYENYYPPMDFNAVMVSLGVLGVISQ
ncbi:PREDICTED: probable L-gulonolactone oxidase 6, partial [Tarenaya hassleriana]|uniref:probable L-gulonolactone oxidase 6 n=1 Tax=Tarenaya hassleriana TaxID=28532 RepID=UPI00053C618F